MGVNANNIEMVKNGSGTSASPWYLLLAVPNNVGGDPTITSITDGSTSFVPVPQTGTDQGAFLKTTSGSIYDFVNPSITGDNSMNASNLFGSQEQAAFGSTPSSFEIYEYTFTPSFDSNIAYTITFGGTGLSAGTFLAVSGGSNPFSTPFTTAGIVDGPSPVPEPTSLLLLATAAVIVGTAYKKKVRA